MPDIGEMPFHRFLLADPFHSDRLAGERPSGRSAGGLFPPVVPRERVHVRLIQSRRAKDGCTGMPPLPHPDTLIISKAEEMI